MKTISSFLTFCLCVSMAIIASSCSEDANLPKVSITMTYESGVISEGEVYIAQPDELIIKSIDVTAENKSHKATSGPVTYWLNGMSLGTNPVAPFGITIPTKNLEPGIYALQLSMAIYEEDCELSTATAVIVVHIVADATELPSESEGPVTEVNYTLR